jgi:hypothetical protein
MTCHPDEVLLELTGSSCSGKTTLAYAVGERLGRLAVHDFDELGVPEAADQRWRNRMTEMCVRRVLEYQDCGSRPPAGWAVPVGRGPGQPLRPAAGWNRGVSG